MTRTLWILLGAALIASQSGKLASASTWHSDRSLNGYYCPGGGKRAHLEDCNRGRKTGEAKSPGQANAAVRAACRNDATKYCGAVIKDAETRRACMKAHHADLSAACRAALAK